MTPTVFHLVGPASGKRTIGLHLAGLTGAARLAPPDVDQIFTSYLTAQESGHAAL